MAIHGKNGFGGDDDRSVCRRPVLAEFVFQVLHIVMPERVCFGEGEADPVADGGMCQGVVEDDVAALGHGSQYPGICVEP